MLWVFVQLRLRIVWMVVKSVILPGLSKRVWNVWSVERWRQFIKHCTRGGGGWYDEGKNLLLGMCDLLHSKMLSVPSKNFLHSTMYCLKGVKYQLFRNFVHNNLSLSFLWRIIPFIFQEKWKQRFKNFIL